MQIKVFIRIINLLIIIVMFSLISFSYEKDGNLTIEPYVFENGKKEKIPAEFGRLKVPENRKNSKSKMIELAFVRFKSTSKNPGSPIVYLAGGPGGSGIQSAKYSRFNLFMAMREFGDVIALDQRGTGDSKPNLACSNRLDLPFDKPLTLESVVKEESEKIKVCAEAFEKQGVDVSAYNTVESANDLNDLRIALGAKKISLWGISYGTHLTLATIRQHGKNIDKAILAGVEGVDDTYKLPSHTQNLMEELDKRAKADTELSKTVPDFLGLIKKVHKQLETKPATVEVTDPRSKNKYQITLGKFDLQFLVSGFSGSNEAQSQFPKIYHALSIGDYSFLAQQMAGYRKGRVSSIMSVAMDCASGISKKRLAQINKEKLTSLFEDAINSPFPGVCDALNYMELGEEFRKPVKSNVPVLFISGTLDGRTPVSNAEFTKQGFKKSSHLIIDGAGHSDPLFISSPKIEEMMKKFMSGESLPNVIEIETAKPFKFQMIQNEANSQNSETKKMD